MAVSSNIKSYRLPKITATGVEISRVVRRQNGTVTSNPQQENTLHTNMQGGMRMYAAGDKEQAWVEICLCPLTQKIMIDPVVASDGITYERKSIQEWMEHSENSPWDSQPLEHKDLIPNSLVLNLISQLNLA